MHTLTYSKWKKLFSALTVLFLIALAPFAIGKGGGGGGGGFGGGGGSKGGTKAAPPPPVNYVDTMLKKYDANSDGQLEKEEMHQMWLNDKDMCVEGLKFDEDKNLALDIREIAKWRESVTQKNQQAAAAAKATP